MMKLYYSTGTCSMSCHIAMEEAGLEYTPIEVSFQKNINTAELEKINPLGMVPALVSDKGKTLTQNLAILEFIADQKPTSHLLPEMGTWERNHTMSWLSFVASDLHKSIGMLFGLKDMASTDSAQKEVREFQVGKIKSLLTYVDKELEGKEYIATKNFSVADAYLFTIMGWTKWVEIDTRGYKNITSYMKRVYDRPAVQKVLKSEDLMDVLQ